jgi:hypothetical protein
MPITIDLETHPFASKFFLKGRAEGLAEGHAEGETAGKAEMLLRQLRRRFPTLPSDTESRVRAGNNEQLDQWSERLVDGKPLAEILGTDQTH